MSTHFVSAQPPPTINYQAVVRDAQTGLPLANTTVFISFEISNDEGVVLFQENHNEAFTNDFGLISLEIGAGEAVVGTLDAVDWQNGAPWLKMSIDVGDGLQILQESRFTSVPYAMYAGSVENTDDADADPTNELIEEVLFDHDSRELSIAEGGNTTTVWLGSIDDADADPTNELVDSLVLIQDSGVLRLFQNGGEFVEANLSELIGGGTGQPGVITAMHFDEDTWILTLSDESQTWTVNLSALVDDADSDPTNELIDDVQFDHDSRELSISEGGNTTTVWLGSVNDADADPFNELVDSLVLNQSTGVLRLFQNDGESVEVDLSNLIQTESAITDMEFDPSSGTLTIGDNTQSWSVDLTPLIDDADADPTNELIEDVTFDSGTRELTILEGGISTSVSIGGVDDADADPTNELITDFDFQSSDGTLRLTEGGIDHQVDLTPLIDDADADPTNELIEDVTFDSGTRELTILEGGISTSVSIGGVEDADADPTNELITDFDFQTSDGTLRLTEGGIDHQVDLTPLIDDADADPTNELIEDVTFDSGTRELTILEGGISTSVSIGGVEDADADPTNELITDFDFQTSDGTLLITEGGIDHQVDLTPLIDDADADPTNELIEDVTFDSGTRELTILEGGISTSVSIGGVDDADADPTNELQDLELDGHDLGLTQSAATVDLSKYDQSNLEEGRVFIGNSDDKAEGRNISGDVDLSADGSTEVRGLRGVPISTASPDDGDMLVYDADDNQWVPVTPPTPITGQIGFYSVDPTDFVEAFPSYSNSGNYPHLKLTGESAVSAYFYLVPGDMIAPIHLPHDATILDFSSRMTCFLLNNVQVRLERKQLFTGDGSVELIDVFTGPWLLGGAGNIFFLHGHENINPGNTRRVVQNDLYSYRVRVTGIPAATNLNGNIDPVTNCRFHGVVVKYATN